MCRYIETKYGCGHSTTTSRPCEKAKEPRGIWDSCFSKKPKYCSQPREEKKEFESPCDKCRARAASKTREGRSASKSRKPLGRSASVREPAPAHNENIRLVKGTATERHEFFLQEGAPSRGRSKDISNDKSKDKSRSRSKGKSKDTSRRPPPPLAARPLAQAALDKGKGRSTSVPPAITRVPHDKAAVPPPRGSITNYNNKPLPLLPPNSSKSSKIGGSSTSTSRSSSRNGRPLVPPPRHGPYIPDNAASAVPAPLQPRRLSESQARPPRGDKNAPIRGSQRFVNPGPAPPVPYPVPQHSYKDERERGRDPHPKPVPQQKQPHQSYIKVGFRPHDQGQQQKGQVSQPHHYPPNASRHVEIQAPVPRRKLSKTRLNDAADNFFGGGGSSRSASKTRERSLSRSRGSKHDKHDKHHGKKHQKQPSTASSFMNRIRSGLGYDGDEDSDSDESYACADSRALERGESIRPITTTSRRASVL
ncbi:hypothetical protein N0V85_008093 [Neurospora sp. IMI 360204]|nr:hypothetical protein N0V85_008093 [Neurospora sp. IMI 360204]